MSVGAGVGLKKGVGVIGLAGASLSMTALIGAPGPSLFLAAFEPFLGLRTASEISTPFASYVACLFHNVDIAAKKLSRHRTPSRLLSLATLAAKRQDAFNDQVHVL